MIKTIALTALINTTAAMKMRAFGSTVLCYGMDKADYCDCRGDCGGSYCLCEESKVDSCCGSASGPSGG